jgi:diadenosine tetraphosphate (Ap4A) HIT family hydrolase
MTLFTIDERLLNNTFFVKDLPLCRLFLHNDSRFPWFVLVPRIENVTELFELSTADQNQLMAEITKISLFLKQQNNVFKINVGTLGNIVPQLHIHIIGRMPSDAAWPGPVWGNGSPIHYTDEEKDRIINLTLVDIF